MAAIITCSMTASFGLTSTNTLNSQDKITRGLSFDPGSISLAAGTGPGQANQIAAATLALAASTPQTLDLTAFLDDDGTTKAFSAVKWFWLWIYGTSIAIPGSNPVLLGGAGTNPWAGPWNPASTVVTVQTGFPYLLANLNAGWAVGSGSKNLKLDPGTNAVNVFLALIGLA